MFPGQRTSRRTQNLESMSVNMGVADDGFDDFGIPTSSNRKGRGSVASSKRGGFFSRIKRGSASRSVLDYDGISDDEDGGTFDVIPGLNSVHNQIGGSPYSSGGSGMTSGNNAGGVNSVYNMDAPPRPMSSMSAANSTRASQGEISMDQLTSLRDRHRYPAMDDDQKGGRAMSIHSMSNFDTTPVIPMLGPVHNFQSGSSHNKSSAQQDKYRQRMIESRRALMSSETGIPLSGNPNAKPVDQLSGSSSRSMSMVSVNSQPGGRSGAPSQRTNTMSTMNGQMPAYMMNPGQPGGPQQMYKGVPPHAQQQYQNPNGQAMRPGLGVQIPGGGAPYGSLPRLPPPGQHNGSPMTPYSAGGIPPQQQPYQQQPQYLPQQGYMQHPHNGPAPAMGPPVTTPLLNGSKIASASPNGRLGDQAPEFRRGSQPPQVGLQKEVSESNDFDFGPGSASSPPTSPETTKGELDRSAALSHLSRRSDQANSKLVESLMNDVRVLSIELTESVRREHDLPSNKRAPISAGEQEKNSAAIDRAGALAKAHSELSLERAKREAAEKAANERGNSSVDVQEKLAELEYRHSEAAHLLSIRTEQYDALKRMYTSLEQDYDQRQKETEEVVARAKENDISQKVYEQDQQLKLQLSTLEEENAKLREKLDQYTKRGPLGSRVTTLEDQRAALQEALRAMRERKDAEINALNNRIEMLSQRQRVTSSGSGVGSAGRTPSVASLLISKESSSPTASVHHIFSTGNNPTSPTGTGPEDSQLSLPRIRNSSLSRPASPLRLGLDYNR